MTNFVFSFCRSLSGKQATMFASLMMKLFKLYFYQPKILKKFVFNCCRIPNKLSMSLCVVCVCACALCVCMCVCVCVCACARKIVVIPFFLCPALCLRGRDAYT